MRVCSEKFEARVSERSDEHLVVEMDSIKGSRDETIVSCPGRGRWWRKRADHLLARFFPRRKAGKSDG